MFEMLFDVQLHLLFRIPSLSIMGWWALVVTVGSVNNTRIIIDGPVLKMCCHLVAVD